jgi:hypothetical protein
MALGMIKASWGKRISMMILMIHATKKKETLWKMVPSLISGDRALTT